MESSSSYLVGSGSISYSNLRQSQRVVDTEDGSETFKFYQFETTSAPLDVSQYDDPDKVKSLVYVYMIYSDNQILRTSSKKVQFSTYFGSLGGWLGLLSDGWGLFSILFMIEKFAMLHLNSKALYWWMPAAAYRETLIS